MTHGPTERQLQVLAAWWFARGSYKVASQLIHDSDPENPAKPQSIKNQLFTVRRMTGATTNLDLALRFMDEIHKREPQFIGRAA
jgi:hypothetical protein